MIAIPPVDVSRLIEQGDAIDASLRHAFDEVVQRHRVSGVPLAVWRDGRVETVPVPAATSTMGGPTAERS